MFWVPTAIFTDPATSEALAPVTMLISPDGMVDVEDPVIAETLPVAPSSRELAVAMKTWPLIP